MKQRPRIYYTAAQKALMWERWKAGDTLHEIGKLCTPPFTIHNIPSATGGIRPPDRHRSRLALPMAEREEISRALAAGESIRCIAKRLKRAASTISRELGRNGARACDRAAKADEDAWNRARRLKACKLTKSPELAQIVAVKLQSHWSPEQIAGWLKRTYPHAKDLQVSHEAIYRTLFVQTRGALKKELLSYLRRTRGMRRHRHYTQKTLSHGRIVDAVPISERPACIEDRAVLGHKRFTVATDIKVYFCDPQNPWQRGTSENTNGLLRQYMPKGVDISGYSQDELDAIARKLNERPRKTLGYKTPAEMFNECVASIS